MDLVQVDVVRAQPPQAGFDGGHDAVACHVRRRDLRGQNDLVPPPGNRPAHRDLRGAVAVCGGGVNEGHSLVDARTEDCGQIVV